MNVLDNFINSAFAFRISLASLFTSVMLGLPMNATAEVYIKAEEEPVSYSECKKAIHNGVVVTIMEKGWHIFLYKDKLYTVIASPYLFRCKATNLK